jgi:hypothetical protein
MNSVARGACARGGENAGAASLIIGTFPRLLRVGGPTSTSGDGATSRSVDEPSRHDGFRHRRPVTGPAPTDAVLPWIIPAHERAAVKEVALQDVDACRFDARVGGFGKPRHSRSTLVAETLSERGWS